MLTAVAERLQIQMVSTPPYKGNFTREIGRRPAPPLLLRHRAGRQRGDDRRAGASWCRCRRSCSAPTTRTAPARSTCRDWRHGSAPMSCRRSIATTRCASCRGCARHDGEWRRRCDAALVGCILLLAGCRQRRHDAQLQPLARCRAGDGRGHPAAAVGAAESGDAADAPGCPGPRPQRCRQTDQAAGSAGQDALVQAAGPSAAPDIRTMINEKSGLVYPDPASWIG